VLREKKIVSGHVGCFYITPCGEENLGVETSQEADYVAEACGPLSPRWWCD
jgi:hypothetical protein